MGEYWMDFLRSYQLDIMLALTGILALILFISIVVVNISARSRMAFILLVASATVLLIADRYAYIFRGDQSTLGYWMVRICNFTTFLMTVAVIFFYNTLLKSMISSMTGEKVPSVLRLVDCFCGIQVIMLIVSQFTGLLYRFDSSNYYQRSPYNFLWYIAPLASLIIQFVVTVLNREMIGTKMRIAVFVFEIAPIVASIAQIFVYGFSLSNIMIAIIVIVLYIIALNDMNIRANQTKTMEMDHLRDQQERMERLLDQTATSLITALDAKEEYTQGHSARVAKYARQIAELLGKDEKECDEIYYAGMLHDIGKIAIPDEIINKKGKLTPEEYEIMKQHPVLGRQILSEIAEMPYLAIGANFHHERYDGTGYPEGLAGKAIPELGRILAVADAYDAMSSNRSYRDAIPQQKIREEFIKYSGTQFDPEFAQLMQHLIDLDSEYQMKEKAAGGGPSDEKIMVFDNFREKCTEGYLVTTSQMTITLRYAADDGKDAEASGPSIILFDSLDARVYDDEQMRTDMNYFEYGEIRFDGETTVTGARKAETEVRNRENVGTMTATETDTSAEQGTRYDIFAVRYRDHALFTIRSDYRAVRVIVALPDSTRFLYLGITGEKCRIWDLNADKSEIEIDEDYIPRIAEEISYIQGDEGDVPNVQVDGYRTDATVGIPIRDGMQIRFHTMSLPTARLVWHTAFIDIFSSDDRMVGGENYREFALIRLDGEYWDDSDGLADNNMEIVKKEAFGDWENWKARNKEGLDVSVRFLRQDNKIVTITENVGISIRNTTNVFADTDELFVALSGDQVALTRIEIIYKENSF